MHTAAFVENAGKEALVRALPFDLKMKLDHELAVDALLGDLVAEQTVAAHHKWRGGASKEEIARGLPRMMALKDLDGDRRVEIAAWLELMARGHTRWWEWIPPLVWLRRGPALRSVIREAARALADDRAKVRVRYQALAEAAKELGPLAYARAKVEGTFDTAKTDEDVLGPGERCLEGAQLDAMNARDRERSERIAVAVAAAAKERESFLRPEGCEGLLLRST
jgi:hypothetical protein